MAPMWVAEWGLEWEKQLDWLLVAKSVAKLVALLVGKLVVVSQGQALDPMWAGELGLYLAEQVAVLLDLSWG